eukprot:1157221-Pelagomonas_calceolata.AAC.8
MQLYFCLSRTIGTPRCPGEGEKRHTHTHTQTGASEGKVCRWMLQLCLHLPWISCFDRTWRTGAPWNTKGPAWAKVSEPSHGCATSVSSVTVLFCHHSVHSSSAPTGPCIGQGCMPASVPRGLWNARAEGPKAF